MRHAGYVTLPDGRTVYGSVTSSFERETGAGSFGDPHLEWPSGQELTGAEYDQVVNGIHLWEYVVERLLLMPRQ